MNRKRKPSQLKVELALFKPATTAERETGLLGWIRVRLNDELVVDGIAVRVTADGRHVLSFPVRTDHFGQRHYIVRPLDDRVRRDFEHQVFQALGFDEAAG